jgi:hypothetical protein
MLLRTLFEILQNWQASSRSVIRACTRRDGTFKALLPI